MNNKDFEQFKADVRGLIDDTDRLRAQIERLRALVETGYEEGWEDATCQPMGFDVNWKHSQTRAALQPKEGEG